MRNRRLSLLVAAALVVPAGFAAPALASPAAHARWAFSGMHGASASPRNGAPVSSQYFAGYEWSSTDSEAAAQGTTATFVVPRVTGCTSTATGIFPGAALDTGSSYSAAGMFVGCSGGKSTYFPMLVINGSTHRSTSLHAKPGDTVVVTAAENRSKTRVSVKDTTRKRVSKTLTGAGSSGGVGFPMIGDFAVPVFSSSTEPVPNFGTITFSGSQIDGLPLGSFSSDGLTPFDLYASTSTTLEVSTGNIFSHGESFTTTFVAP